MATPTAPSGNSSAGGLYITVGANVDKALRDLRKLETAAKKLQGTLNAVNKATSRGTGGAATTRNAQATAKAYGQAAKNAQNTAKQTSNVGRQATVATKKVGLLSHAFRNMSLSMQSAFSGFGAARSGNWFYGVSTMLRLTNGLAGGFAGAGLAASALTGGIVALSLAATAATSAVIALGIGFVKLGRYGVQQAATFEMLKLQLTGLLGSAQRGSEEFAGLIKLARTSTVPTQSLIEADRQLLAFGVTSDWTRRRLLKFFADFGTATGATEQQIYYLSLALGQVSSQGKANMIDMRQLANAGVVLSSVYEIIGRKIGKSAEYVQANISKGLITSQVLFDALGKYGKQYEDVAKKARRSTQGLINNIQDIFASSLGIAFEGVNRKIAQFLLKIQRTLKQVDFRYIGQAFEQAMKYVADAFSAVNDQKIDLQYWLEVTLPELINKFGAGIGIVIRSTKTLFLGMEAVGLGVVLILQGVLEEVLGAAAKTAQVQAWLGLVPQAVADAVWQMYDDTSKSAQRTADDINRISKEIEEIWSTPVYKPLTYSIEAQREAAGHDESLRGRAQDYRAQQREDAKAARDAERAAAEAAAAAEKARALARKMAKDARQTAKDLKEQLISERKSFMEAIRDAMIGDIAEFPEASFGAILEGLRRRTKMILRFSRNIGILAQRGLPAYFLRQLVEAGPIEGGQLAQTLVSTPNSDFRKLVQVAGREYAAAMQVAQQTGTMFFSETSGISPEGQEIHVYIGDQELTDIVRVQVQRQTGYTVQQRRAGRKYQTNGT